MMQLTAGGDEALLEAHALASEATAAGLPTGTYKMAACACMISLAEDCLMA